MNSIQRQLGVMKELSQMVRDHVFRTVLKKAPKERIKEMLKTVNCNKSVETFRDGPEFGFYDLLDLVDATGIDIGISIRMRNGEEVTFYPGHNFGKTGGKNGTPREKLAARKPFEYETPAYDYSTQHGHGGVGSLAHHRRRALAVGCGGLYTQDDDDDSGIGVGFGPQLARRAAPEAAQRSTSSEDKEPEIANTAVNDCDDS